MSKVLGIIAGNGVLPLEVAKAYISKGGQVCIAKLPDIDGDYNGYNAKQFKIGEVGSLIDYFHDHNIKKIVIIGAFKKPNLFGIKVDSKGALLLAKIMKAKLFGDDSLLRIVSNFFEENGFFIISALDILVNEITLKPGLYTENVPHGTIENDIKLGLEASKMLGLKDLGQSIIIRNGIIVGEEDQNGTDTLIKRCKGLGGVLIKTMKPIQDERLDIPTIGSKTVQAAADSGLDGIAIEAGKVIVVDSASVIKLANQLGIFIIAV